MTNKEALQAQVGYPLKPESIDIALINAKVQPDTVYDPDTQRQGVETALAGLLFILTTNPKSVSELDFSLSTQEISDLLYLRSIILKRWNLPDDTDIGQTYIQDVTHFWGTTNY